MAIIHRWNHDKGYKVVSSLVQTIIFPESMSVYTGLIDVELEYNHDMIGTKCALVAAALTIDYAAFRNSREERDKVIKTAKNDFILYHTDKMHTIKGLLRQTENDTASKISSAVRLAGVTIFRNDVNVDGGKRVNARVEIHQG